MTKRQRAKYSDAGVAQAEMVTPCGATALWAGTNIVCTLPSTHKGDHYTTATSSFTAHTKKLYWPNGLPYRG